MLVRVLDRRGRIQPLRIPASRSRMPNCWPQVACVTDLTSSRRLLPSGRRDRAVRVAGPGAYVALYVALYAAFGVASPFWPKFFETKGLTAQQIGWLLTAAMLMRLVSLPLVAALADLLGSLRLVLAGCAIVAAAAAAALLRADTFLLLLLVALVQAVALAPTTAIADALSVNAARPQMAGRAFEYGWIRGGASAAFVLGTLAVGQLISPAYLAPVAWLNAILLIAAAVATVWVPGPAAQAASMGGLRSAVDGRFAVLRIPGFRSVIVVSALVYGSHAMHDAFAVIRWSEFWLGRADNQPPMVRSGRCGGGGVFAHRSGDP